MKERLTSPIRRMPYWETYQQFMSRVIGEGRSLPLVIFNAATGEFERRGYCNSGINPTGRQFELPEPEILGDFVLGLTNHSLEPTRRVTLNLENGELERFGGWLS